MIIQICIVKFIIYCLGIRFEEYEFVENNFCRLSISDHYRAHELLANAYPIREFIRPLNFFNKQEDYDYDNHFENISIAAKIEWVKFKETENIKNGERKNLNLLAIL